MTKYIVTYADNAAFEFLNTPVGQTMFNGDGGTDGGGRILNCAEKNAQTVQSNYGYVLTNAIYFLLIPQNETELKAVQNAQLMTRAEFDDAKSFSENYLTK